MLGWHLSQQVEHIMMLAWVHRNMQMISIQYIIFHIIAACYYRLVQ